MISVSVLIVAILLTAAIAGLAFLTRTYLLTRRRPEQRKRGDTVVTEANASSVEQERPLLGGDSASRESIELSEGSTRTATPLPANPGRET